MKINHFSWYVVATYACEFSLIQYTFIDPTYSAILMTTQMKHSLSRWSRSLNVSRWCCRWRSFVWQNRSSRVLVSCNSCYPRDHDRRPSRPPVVVWNMFHIYDFNSEVSQVLIGKTNPTQCESITSHSTPREMMIDDHVLLSCTCMKCWSRNHLRLYGETVYVHDVCLIQQRVTVSPCMMWDLIHRHRHWRPRHISAWLLCYCNQFSDLQPSKARRLGVELI